MGVRARVNQIQSEKRLVSSLYVCVCVLQLWFLTFAALLLNDLLNSAHYERNEKEDESTGKVQK